MDVGTAFDRFNKVITPSGSQRRIADARVAHFTAMLEEIDPRIVVLASGSWARGTSLGPIHDVDLIVVFPPELSQGWDGGDGTATAALGEVRQAIQERLESHYGLPYVWRTVLRNHVVKCYIDSRGSTESPAGTGFSVEVMPALRDGSALRVPERRGDRWRTVDPEHLRNLSAHRQDDWKHYTAMVRLLKHWAREHPKLNISPLAMEVLALKCLPDPPLLRGMSRTEALKKFFTAAAAEVMKGVRDPADRSGEIAPDLDRRRAREQFLQMADLAATAEAWEKAGHKDGQDIAVYFLRLIFGKKFPAPARDWSSLEAEPWWRRAPWAYDRPREAAGERFGGPWERPWWADRKPTGPAGGPHRPGPQAGPGGPPPQGGPHRPGPDGPGGPGPGGPGPGGGGVSLRNPGGHRVAMPAIPVAAPAAPRAEDPAG